MAHSASFDRLVLEFKKPDLRSCVSDQQSVSSTRSALVSSSKILYHNCFVLGMGPSARGPCTSFGSERKEPRMLTSLGLISLKDIYIYMSLRTRHKHWTLCN